MHRKRLSQLALVLLITSAVDNIRCLPQTALFGSTLFFFFLFSAVVFLIPVALVSAQLSSLSSEKGGIYHWTQLALGENVGLLAVWLQWINTLVWFPAALSFIAATASYFLNPALINNKTYLVSFVLIAFWCMTFINLHSVHTSAKFANICSTLGTGVPLFLIIGLGILWVILGKPVQLHFNAHTLFPKLTHSENWLSLTAIITSFVGIELATVHVNEVNNPETVFPKALFISVMVILFTMTMGSLSIALTLPLEQINLVGGTMQAFSNFFLAYHITGMIPIITFMIIMGGLGSMVTWIISPAKGILQAAERGYLPSALAVKNKHGVPSRLLILQAVIVSLACLAFQLMPSVNGSYWLLSDLSTQLYILMYVLMFIAAMVLKKKHPESVRGFKIPGKKWGTWSVCLLGLLGCLVTLCVGFLPPSNIDVGGKFHYTLIFTSGILILMLPISFFFFFKKWTTK
ncbi:MAG: APC family permease [Chthoniobacterales bacterium]|nr:APC family permease [Chthoniobacterales bacterium]